MSKLAKYPFYNENLLISLYNDGMMKHDAFMITTESISVYQFMKRLYEYSIHSTITTKPCP